MPRHPLSIAFVLALVPSIACALGIRIVDQDPAATARAEAFTATADNPSAIYFNPAGITQIDGLSARLGVYGIGLQVHATPEHADGFDSHEKALFTPQAFLTYKPKVGPFTFGLGAYTPYGLELEYPDRTPFRQLAKFGQIKFFTVNPVIALQVTRTLSVAFGATLNSVQVDLRQGILGPEFGGGDEFKFKGMGTTAGFTAGVLWKPTEQHSFGLNYHSGVTVDFSGHSAARLSDKERADARHGNELVAEARKKVDVAEAQVRAAPLPPAAKAQIIAGIEAQYAEGLAAQGVPPGGFPETLGPEQDANAKFRFPQFVMAGYSFRPTPAWNFEADVDWTDWDVLNDVHLHQQNSPDINLPFNWKHSWIFEFGATHYFPFHGLRASAGYAYSLNSVPSQSFNPAVPDSNRHIFAAGFGQTVNDFTWDFAYQLAYGPTRTIDNDTLADGRYRFLSHALTFAVGYHF
ncbi:MAG: long-chain fatty acid transport protein [Chthoniobacter sp.]|nr:long-chain fatty acid transport protein [Chthoniobacter sp.]